MTMFIVNLRRLLCAVLGASPLLLVTPVQADGMVPNTSVVIVNEADGEASISVTNTDNSAALLHVTLENTPEDTESLLFVTPPLARVEASQTQLVRFILQTGKPLQTQRLKRVIFEGIPQGKAATEPGHARVGVTVRQNLPVILHPKGLAPNRTPWTGLQWSLEDGQLSVRNDTPYVVRLGQEVQLLPSAVTAMLPKSYVLPGEHIRIPAPEQAATHVRFQPATVYGFAVPHYEADIKI